MLMEGFEKIWHVPGPLARLCTCPGKKWENPNLLPLAHLEALCKPLSKGLKYRIKTFRHFCSIIGGLSGKESACQWRRHRFIPWVGKIPWRRKWQPTPSWEVPWQRSLAGYSPWGHNKLDMTKKQQAQSLPEHEANPAETVVTTQDCEDGLYRFAAEKSISRHSNNKMNPRRWVESRFH